MVPMKIIFTLALLSSSAFAAHPFETDSTANRVTNVRAYRDLPDDAGVVHHTLVVDTKITGQSRIRIDLDQPLLFQWVQNDLGKTVPTSIPYYEGKIIALPDSPDLSAAERARLLEGTYFFTVYDLTPANVVASTFDGELPTGGHKPILALPWDAYNPKGTWGNSIEEALSESYNSFLTASPPNDVKDFCPKFTSLDKAHKVHFWQTLVAEIAALESSNLPYCASDEGNYNPDSKGVISSGLVQSSLLSVKATCYQARGCTEIKGQDDLYDPAHNLHCGLGVMSCLAEKYSCISCKNPAGAWTGIAAYWSTLRDPYQVPCATCPSGHARVGFKPDIQLSLKTSASYCF
jgi:hypothetical protein